MAHFVLRAVPNSVVAIFQTRQRGHTHQFDNETDSRYSNGMWIGLVSTITSRGCHLRKNRYFVLYFAASLYAVFMLIAVCISVRTALFHRYDSAARCSFYRVLI